MTTEMTTMPRPTVLAEHNNGAAEFAALVSMGDQLRRTGFLPSHIRDGVSFAAIVLMGRELGMGTMAACRKLQVIKGTVTERADSQLARFKSAGGRAEFKELTETKAVLSLKHPNGDQHTETFTIEDAKRAGLASNDNYAKHPKAMLRSRAITAGLKSIGWEGAVGIYDPDEVSDPEPAKPVAVTQAAPVIRQPVSPQDTLIVKAKLEIGKASTLDRLEELRRAVADRSQSGKFTADEVAELVALITHRAEMLIGEGEPGQEFAHEAAEPLPKKVATDDDIFNARNAIQRAKTREKLDQIKQTIFARQDAGFYSSSQASELITLVDGKLDWIVPKGDAYEPEDNGVEHHDAQEVAAEARS